MKFTRLRLAWVPPARADMKVTAPPPIAGEVGGMFGVSIPYSKRLSETPYWRRMAQSSFASRMNESATTYPMSASNPDEYDMRYLPRAYPDPQRNRALLEIGEANTIPQIKVPVILLADTTVAGVFLGRKNETVYVASALMRRKLSPQRAAMYATPENYKLLGLPVVDLKIHQEIPKTLRDYEKLRAKQQWEHERWRFSFPMLYRNYEMGPPELLDDAPLDWDGVEELAPAGGAGAGGAGAAAGRKGPIKMRKARKVKLF
jgi:hypothetical protein